MIDYVPTTTLFDIRTSLKLLDLSENPIASLPSHGFHGLYGLQTLIISNMPNLNSIDALAFHDLHSLTTLECRNNPNLSWIHPKAFRDNLYQEKTDSVKVLDLRKNKLCSLSEDLLNWSSLELLKLSGNPWMCHCSLLWLLHLPADIFHTDEHLYCDNHPLMTKLRQECEQHSSWILPTLITSFFIILIVIMVTTFYILRQKFKAVIENYVPLQNHILSK